jgi:hypothetical protein
MAASLELDWHGLSNEEVGRSVSAIVETDYKH